MLGAGPPFCVANTSSLHESSPASPPAEHGNTLRPQAQPGAGARSRSAAGPAEAATRPAFMGFLPTPWLRAPRADPKLQGQHWVREGQQGGAPSLLLPWLCSATASGSRSSRPGQVFSPPLSDGQAQVIPSGQTLWLFRHLSACGGRGRRSPGGGSLPAPGSSHTSPAPCGTRFAAADPTQRAAPPSDTGQPSARSSCDSAGPPGTPLWSPHAPWPAASGSCLLVVQPLARPQGSPSVAAVQWPSGLVAGPLGY